MSPTRSPDGCGSDLPLKSTRLPVEECGKSGKLLRRPRATSAIHLAHPGIISALPQAVIAV
jgi:hypothetical protein